MGSEKMAFFKKKHSKVLFGSNIEPNCSYCLHNHGKSGKLICSIKKAPQESKCKKYVYDPIKRQPMLAPALKTEAFTKDDFIL